MAIRETTSEKKEIRLDKIRGCLIGGAVGDALGYPVEFLTQQQILGVYGEKGISEYELDPDTGKALISDDTQMSLFTANGILVGETRQALRGISANPRAYVFRSYEDWLRTQQMSYENSREGNNRNISWLSDVKELYSWRYPGRTCISALMARQVNGDSIDDFISEPLNDSKGCGGVMRVAPLALAYVTDDIERLDMEGAQIAAITHGHSLGYMPAAMLCHIISRIVYPEKEMSLKEIVLEAKETVNRLFSNDKHINELDSIIDLAIELSENDLDDLTNINAIGEGWVAEETLAIAVYCALRHQDDFSAGVMASVNHKGDSDSTGAVTGNILGALLGYKAIDDKWKKDLELKEVILEMADDLSDGCQMSEHGDYRDEDWLRKYVHMNH